MEIMTIMGITVKIMKIKEIIEITVEIDKYHGKTVELHGNHGNN